MDLGSWKGPDCYFSNHEIAMIIKLDGFGVGEQKIGISPAAFHANARTNFSSSYFQGCIISGIPPLMTFTSGPPKTNPWPKERWCRKKENEKYVNERGMNTFLGEIFVALFFLSDANSWLEYHYPQIVPEQWRLQKGIWIFPPFLALWKIQFEFSTLFNNLRHFNFPLKINGAGKFKFPEFFGEYRHFLYFSCFNVISRKCTNIETQWDDAHKSSFSMPSKPKVERALLCIYIGFWHF